MRGNLSRCVLAIAISIGASASAWAQVSATINGSAMAERSYSNEFNGATQLTDFGQDSGNNAIMTANGFVGTYVTLAQPGQVSFTASATGTASGGVDPNMTISIADYHQSFDVTPGTNNYTFTTPVLPKGMYFVRTQLDNQQGSTIKPTLQVNSFTASSDNTTNVSVSNVDNNNNALTAANTYIDNFRQGTANVPTGFASGQQIQVSMVRNAFNFGTNVTGASAGAMNNFIGNQGTSQQTNFQAYLNKHFNSLVTSNMGKWSLDEATQNTVTMGDMDEMLSYAKAHNMTARAHNLIWGAQQPSWISNGSTGLLDQAQAGNATAKTQLMTAINNRIGYFVGGGDPAATNSTSPGNQLTAMNTFSNPPGNTNDIRSRDYQEIDVLNEPMNNPAYLKGIGYSGIAQVYKNVQTAANNANANVGLYTNEFNVIQNSKARYDPTTFASSGTDSYANWYAQYINQVNNSGQGKVVTGAGIEWYPAVSMPNASTYQQVLQTLAVQGVSISVPEGGVQSSITGQSAAEVQGVDDIMRMMYGNPNATTFMLWSTWGGATSTMNQSSILVGAVGNTTNWNLTATGTRYEYLFGQGTDSTATAATDNGVGGVNQDPWNTPDQTASVNPDGSLNFRGAYGEYALKAGGVTYATVDFEKTGTSLWVKGDFNLDGKLDPADLQAALAALKSQNRVASGSLIAGYQQLNNMSNEEFLAICDVNGDGYVNAQDLAGLLTLMTSGIEAGNGIFGGGGSVAAVPEPASVILGAMSLGLFVFVAQRRKKRS
jgi:GH35 family endo-1,4-beta-xylanase